MEDTGLVEARGGRVEHVQVSSCGEEVEDIFQRRGRGLVIVSVLLHGEGGKRGRMWS